MAIEPLRLRKLNELMVVALSTLLALWHQGVISRHLPFVAMGMWDNVGSWGMWNHVGRVGPCRLRNHVGLGAWGGACCPLFRYPQLIEAPLFGSNDLNVLNDLSDLKIFK